MTSMPLLSKGDKVLAHDPEDNSKSVLIVSGNPWYNPADNQWYYPIQDVDDSTMEGDISDAELKSGSVVKI